MGFRLSLFMVLPPLLVGIATAGCSKQDTPAVQPKRAETAAQTFTDVTVAAGINHQHHKPILDHKLDNIMNWVASVGAAVAVRDFDNDGYVDLYVTNSRKGTPNYLYRNNGDGTFTDVADTAGVADLNNDGGTTMDCVWGDYDNDGWADLYVVRWGNDLLFRNNGDGTFADVTRRSFRKRDGSAGTDWANGNAAIFFDYNLDGRLDIYVGNYFDDIDLWHLPHTRIMHDDFKRARNGGKNHLYRQEADGSFTEVAASLGLDDPGWTLAVGSADVNNDGWPDLYCADDFGPDQFFYNNRDGTFTNVSNQAIGFDTQKGMNVDFGDFNNDGWLDIYVTNITTTEYLQEGNMLWHNNGPDSGGVVTFTDISIEAGVYDGGWGWGAKFLDYDNDGDLDLFAVNGFISAGEGNYWYDLASWTVLGQDAAEARNWPAIGDRSFSGHELFRFWRNDGLDSFTLQTRAVGLASDRDGRGVAYLDYDNDGDLDLFVANQDQRPHLFRNDTINRGGIDRSANTGGHWLMVDLQAGSSGSVNRDGVGARVTVVTDRGLQLRERDGGNGYSGQSDPRLHFGLGEERVAKLIEVRWPDGGLQYLENVPADQIITIRRDVSQYATDAMVIIPPPQSKRAERSRAPRRPTIDPEEIKRLLSDLEEHIRLEPESYPLADVYRLRCVAFDRHDRSIDFFAALAKSRPSHLQVHLNWAAAYIDKIPTCGGLAAIVSKGTLARKALDVMNALGDTRGDPWLFYYARGMNHLHWPRALRHSDDAAADFKRCLEIQLSAGPPNEKKYYERTYLLLGDAHAKNKSYADARDAWRAGLKAFPDSQTLPARLAITDDAELLKFIVRTRGLEKPVDTGFSFIDRER